MKNTLFTALFLVAIAQAFCNAQGSVNDRSKSAFLTDFGDIKNVTWSKSAQFDEATFVTKGQKKTAYYDFGSKLVGFTETKKYSDLPAPARKTIEKDYQSKGYIPGAVIFFDDSENNDADMLLFGTQFEDKDHYFVTVTKNGSEEVLMVTLDGVVSYFKKVK